MEDNIAKCDNCESKPVFNQVTKNGTKVGDCEAIGDIVLEGSDYHTGFIKCPKFVETEESKFNRLNPVVQSEIRGLVREKREQSYNALVFGAFSVVFLFACIMYPEGYGLLGGFARVLLFLMALVFYGSVCINVRLIQLANDDISELLEKIGEKRIAFESDIESTGSTHNISDIEEYEAILGDVIKDECEKTV